MITTLDQLGDELNRWFKENCDLDRAVDIDEDIIDTRVVDSLQFILMVVHIESLSDAELKTENLNVDDFRTIRKIHESCFSTGVTA